MDRLLHVAVLVVAVHLIPYVCFRRIKPPTFAEKLYLGIAHGFWNVAILFAVVLSLNSGNLLLVPLVATLLFVLSKGWNENADQTVEYPIEDKQLVDCMEQMAILQDQLNNAYRQLNDIDVRQKRHSKSEVTPWPEN